MKKTNYEEVNKELCKLMQSGDEEAKERLCIVNESLVAKYAKEYAEKDFKNSDKYELIKDLTQAGMTGLVEAAKRFDETRTENFSTYAVIWIKKYIREEMHNNGFVIRVPANVMNEIIKVGNLDSKYFSQGMDYSERIQAIADELNVQIELVEYYFDIKYKALSVLSLNKTVGEDEETEMQDLIEDTKGNSVEEIVATNLLHDLLFEVLSTLSERDQKILKLRYGLEDGQVHSLEQIGREFNISKVGIGKIEKKALKKLRESAEAKKLEDYV